MRSRASAYTPSTATPVIKDEVREYSVRYWQLPYVGVVKDK